MTDEELKSLVAGLAISQQKTDEQLARTDAQIAATNTQLAKTDAQLAKTDAQLAKTDAQLAKTDAQLAKTDTRLNKVSELVGNLTNNYGEYAEDFFYRSLIDNTWLGERHFDVVYRNTGVHKGKINDEFDLVLLNDDSVAVIEVKQKAHPKLVDDMLTRKLPNFRALFPHYNDLTLYGGIASLISNEELIRKTKEAGLFFLTQKAEHIVLVNDEVRPYIKQNI